MRREAKIASRLDLQRCFFSGLWKTISNIADWMERVANIGPNNEVRMVV
ncbi:MAG: hypothetical protein JWO64_2190, partial [Hyphomicrobiales bacterium]|nr:hypothetical protein [Hyphomicrobiales bacterium]